MAAITRSTDDKARVSLPKSFANATVLIEQVSDTEVRIRKARIVPEDAFRFSEESGTLLSKRDRQIFLAALAEPPPPNASLKKAVAMHKRRRA
ncbi:MAG TPA: DUF1778 domain-containing protein [Polyangiaceae bacterium]